MSTGSLSTRRAAGWMKIDRENEGQKGGHVVGLDASARRSRKGLAKGVRMLEVAEHRVLIALVASWRRKGG